MVGPPVEVSKEHWGEYIECDGDKASWGRGDKEADEDRRTGAFAKIFWLSCALMRRYGGPNGIRTRSSKKGQWRKEVESIGISVTY